MHVSPSRDRWFLNLHSKVLPTMQQYELDTFGRSHDVMSNFWNSCFDDLMSTAFKRDKDRSDSKSKFQVGNIFPGFCLRPFTEHFKTWVATNPTRVMRLCANRKRWWILI